MNSIQSLIDVKKRYRFKPPFDSRNINLEITLIGIIDITALIAGTIDVFTLVYKPVGLTDEDMRNDIRNGVKLLNFKLSENEYMYVPASYLTDDIDEGMLMVGKVLIFNLGAVPTEDESITDELAQNCASVITKSTGIVPTFKFFDTTGNTHISKDDVIPYISRRLLARETTSSYYLKYIEAQETLDAKSAEIERLKEIILNT